MARAPFQVLVLPFRRTGGGAVEFAILCRHDLDLWQGVAGGGEEDETPSQAAVRETREELGLDRPAPLYPLQTVASIPARFFAARHTWPKGTYVVPEYSFAADVTGLDIILSKEHTAVRWLDAKPALAVLRFDSNRTALEELAERLETDDLADPVG
jgi:dihydroneopterin triphosphate diphosphatase